MPEKAEVSVKLLDAILQYLAMKPYTEVSNLIAGLHAEVNPQMQPKEPAE